MDTSFWNSYSLLFHDFVNSNSVSFIHLIKLVDTYQALVSKHHCTCIKMLFSCILINGDCCCQTNTWRSSSSRCNCKICKTHCLSQHLRLSCGWISNKKDVDVSSQMSSVFEVVSLSSKKLKENGLFDQIMALNWGSNSSCEKLESFRLFWNRFDVSDIFRSHLLVEINLEIRDSNSNQDSFKNSIEFRFHGWNSFVDSSYFNSVSWFYSIAKTSIKINLNRSR